MVFANQRILFQFVPSFQKLMQVVLIDHVSHGGLFPYEGYGFLPLNNTPRKSARTLARSAARSAQSLCCAVGLSFRRFLMQPN